VTVEAGCVLAAVQKAADDAGRLFPLSLAAEGSCQIGGNLSTNAGGVNVLRYGTARDQVLGLEVVLPDGRVWNGLRACARTIPVTTLSSCFSAPRERSASLPAAVLRLHPRPTATATAWIALDSPPRAVELLALLRERLGDRLSAFELVSRNCLEAVLFLSKDLQDPLASPHAWYVLVDLGRQRRARVLHEHLERALFECAERGALRDAVLAQSGEQARALLAPARKPFRRRNSPTSKHDVSVPVSKTPELIDARRSRPGKRVSRRAAVRLRPRGRRQPALQRRPEALIAQRVSGEPDRLRRGWRASAARSRRSMAWGS